MGLIIAILIVLLRRRHKLKYKEEDTVEVQRYPTLTPYDLDPNSDYISVGIRSEMATVGYSGTGVDDMEELETTVISPFVPPSTKASREARLRPRPRGTQQSALCQPAPTSPHVGSQTGSASSREPPSLTGESISTTDVVGLRTEVENLRRVMRDIRAEGFEPPPEYADPPEYAE